LSRGKHKARKQNRDAAQLADDLARVRAQLVEERARLAEVGQRAALDAQLRADLADAIAARDAACAPQLERIADDRVAICTATRELAETTRQIRRHCEKIIEWSLDEFGHEGIYAVLTGNRAQLNQGVVSTRLESDAIQTIQRARGLRKISALDFTQKQKQALGAATAAATGIALPDDVIGIDGDGWDAYTDLVASDTAALIAFKLPVPWLDTAPDLGHTVSRVLGANPAAAAVTVGPPDTVPTVTDLSTGTAALRDAATAAGATKIASAFTAGLQHSVNLAARSQIPSPVAGSPAHPAPADAASLHVWYATAAMGTWARDRTPTNGRIAVAAAAAVPFWLPPGHTIAYLDSEPLSGDDVDEMRLPFAQVLVAFAEPARLPALNQGALPDDDPRLAWIDHLVADSDGVPDSREVLIAGTNSFTAPLPTLWAAIAARGAHIEAILLLADAHGHLDDLFAWCIAIPSTTAGAVIGRWVIPASRSTTSYANLVANAAAVAAWADWHRPGHSRDVNKEEAEQTLGDDVRASRQRAEDTVHVLNATATTTAEPSTSTRGQPTGRTTTPHRRRGHWRRQHYGPGRTEIRRIRIAPVMVNAGRLGTDRPQIYRLPAPTPPEPRTTVPNQ
jgi:hypothetical protein